MSAQKFRPALRTLALLLPIVAIVGMIARAEMVLQTGRSWQVRIKGYDPRDLLRGQYLRYTIDWQLQGEATCQGGSCCYCLWDAGLSPVGAPAPLAPRFWHTQPTLPDPRTGTAHEIYPLCICFAPPWPG